MAQKPIYRTRIRTKAKHVKISSSYTPSIVQISGGTFYRHQRYTESTVHNLESPLFPNVNFSVPSSTSSLERWAVIGPASAGKTTFLELLRGQHLCAPPTARSYPYLSSEKIVAKDPRLRNPSRAIKYVGFSSEQSSSGRVGAKGSYLSARYESRREETDFTLLDHLQGNTSLNAALSPKDTKQNPEKDTLLARTVKELNLEMLINMPLSTLSNGQTRRALIAKALLDKPELLLLDEPFMGLDPATQAMLSSLLKTLADNHSPRLMLALRPQDPIPEWITHVVTLGPSLRIQAKGERKAILGKAVRGPVKQPDAVTESGSPLKSDPTLALNYVKQDSLGTAFHGSQATGQSGKIVFRMNKQELLVQMNGVHLSYGEKTVLGGWKQDIAGEEREGLWWQVRRGETWGIFGANGSGKTTILSLICSDHPQTYSLPIELFGRSRLPQSGQPGISIFDLQARVGHSSPEIHAFFPPHLSVRRSLESAWADTFIGKPNLSPKAVAAIQACLKAFQRELNLSGRTSLRPTPWDELYKQAELLRFGDLSFSAQRVILFLRAIVKRPDIVILDEAFSGMDESLRDRCMMHLQDWLTPDQALICVSHVKEEVPPCVRQWMWLPDEPGVPARFGSIRFGETLQTEEQWNRIWGIQ